MATIHKTMIVSADPAAVWDVYRDVGALHIRLVPGFVTDTVLEEGSRLVIDLLPDEVAPAVDGMMNLAVAVTQRTLDAPGR